MSTSINKPKVVSLNHEEICEAIKEAARKKDPELTDEEFEVEISYSSYGQNSSAKISTL